MKNVVAEIAIANGGGNQQPIYDIMYEMFDIGGMAKIKGFKQTIEFADELWEKLRGIDCEKFYTKSGAKITKSLKAFLENQFGKESTKLVFPEFCKRVSNIYIEVKAEATLRNHYFTTNEGGKWNDDGSCFLDGGCNSQNGEWIDASPGIGVITIRPENKTYGKGRIIVWFINPTTAHMVNVYSGGRGGEREIPRSIFVKALEEMSKTQITWSQKEEKTLNIYLNRNPMVLKATEGTFDTVCQNYVFKCTVCNKNYDYNKNNTNNADEYLNACSESCMDDLCENLGGHITCNHCGNGYDEENMYNMDGDLYCEGCYNEFFFFCESCNNDREREGMQEVRHKRSNMLICETCFDKHWFECSECSKCVHNDDAAESEEGNSYCPECVQKYCEVCSECAGIRDDHADFEDGVCPDCLETKIKEVA